MRVLTLTQVVEASDPLLGFTAGWIRALALRVAHVDVLCLRGSSDGLPANVAVHSVGHRGEAAQAARAVAFQRTLWPLVRRSDVVFAHMVPRYACLAAPAALAFGRPLVLWYVHRAAGVELRAATRASRLVVTAVRDSFPLASDKVRVIGHGIDDRFFAPPAPGEARVVPPDDAGPQAVFVGRLMPVKHQATLVRALARTELRDLGVRGVFVGGVPGGVGDGYARDLRAMAASPGLEGRVSFVGSMGADAIRSLWRRAALAVNLSPPGLFDKAALEALLTGVPTVVANPAFDNLLGAHAARLRVGSPDDDAGLARLIAGLLSLAPDERDAMTRDIRTRVAQAHGLDGMMDRLVHLFGQVA